MKTKFIISSGYHSEIHFSKRAGWLRAAVLGANDGLISTASLIVGMAAGQAAPDDILLAGVAGLVAGCMSMAAGEYVSVSSQSDTEKADIKKEQKELATNIDHEYQELAEIYQQRGLNAALAREVAEQLMAHDALGSHARDELGIIDGQRARPLQAALASGLTFAIGASLPLTVTFLAPIDALLVWVASSTLFFLVSLGLVAAKAGGAPLLKGAIRVGFWGSLALATTATIGSMVGLNI